MTIPAGPSPLHRQLGPKRFATCCVVQGTRLKCKKVCGVSPGRSEHWCAAADISKILREMLCLTVCTQNQLRRVGPKQTVHMGHRLVGCGDSGGAHVVANAGAVRRVIVVAKHAELVPLPQHHLLRTQISGVGIGNGCTVCCWQPFRSPTRAWRDRAMKLCTSAGPGVCSRALGHNFAGRATCSLRPETGCLRNSMVSRQWPAPVARMASGCSGCRLGARRSRLGGQVKSQGQYWGLAEDTQNYDMEEPRQKSAMASRSHAAGHNCHSRDTAAPAMLTEICCRAPRPTAMHAIRRCSARFRAIRGRNGCSMTAGTWGAGRHAPLTRWVRADGVEVPQQDDAPVLLGSKQVPEHVLDHQLRPPVRRHRLWRKHRARLSTAPVSRLRGLILHTLYKNAGRHAAY